MVDHGNGIETLYAHASKNLVSVGDKVEKGDLIALVGTTGTSTGNHLHFEFRVDGQFADPMNYIDFSSVPINL
jgi:murein DD-endopeptidase MepM/ murein hydrolase activator NlpD